MMGFIASVFTQILVLANPLPYAFFLGICINLTLISA